MNSVVLIGRLTKDVELRYMQNSDKYYARFTLAIDRGLSKEKKEEAQSTGQATADFINIVVWNKQAENCQKYLSKGRNVAIQGRIQTGSYVAQDGTKKYTTDILAEKVQFIDWGDNKTSNASNGQDTMPFGMFSETDEEIPF